MSSLIHIAPQLPPAIDGVGDYCWNLWKHWPNGDDAWHCLALRNADKTAAHWPEVAVHGFQDNAVSLRAILEGIPAETLVLHYVSYGFQPKGIPTWLPQALKHWRNAVPSRRVVTMFHEMYARSSPLRSPFWVAPVAKRIIRELVVVSDAWATSCERYSEQLVHSFGASPALGRIVPIATNVPLSGALAENPFQSGTKLRIVVFGLAKTRLWALEKHWRLLRVLNEAASIESITLLGKSPDAADAGAFENWKVKIGGGITWRNRFDLSREEISGELVQHHAGLLANVPDILTKSGVFAAFAAHGVVPVIAGQSGDRVRGKMGGAALVNDDRQYISRAVQCLRDPVRMAAMRDHLLDLAAHELSWPSLGRSWAGLLRLARGEHSPFEESAHDQTGTVNQFAETVGRV